MNWNVDKDNKEYISFTLHKHTLDYLDYFLKVQEILVMNENWETAKQPQMFTKQ